MFQHIRTAVRGSADRARDRWQYQALLQLEDHLLRDIGLPRDEIRARMLGVRDE